jgi:hypothetical protein
MRMPGFTTETSLLTASSTYRAVRIANGSAAASVLAQCASHRRPLPVK